MTDDLEKDLAEALEGRGRVDPVEVQRVLDSTVLPARHSATGGLARLVAAVLIGGLALGAVAIGLSNRGVAAPGTTATTAPAGPVTATGTDGTFKLTVTAAHATYRVGDPIAVTTTLTYLGSPAQVNVYGSGSGLVGFYVQQDGHDRVGGAETADCRPYAFTSGQPVEVPFTKSGGYVPGASGADFVEQYVRDPLLHLPTGTWHIHAEFVGSIDTCTPTPHTLDVSVTVVIAEASSVSSLPAATFQATLMPSIAVTPTVGPTDARVLPLPAGGADDPRYAVCTQPALGMPPVLSAFAVGRARDLPRYVPAFNLSPELQIDDPAFIVVYNGPVKTIVPGGSLAAPDDPGATLEPGHYDACVVIGSAAAIHSHGFYGDVSFVEFDPAPSGLPALP